MQALIAGLEDIHLEVRFQCGRALDALRQRSGIEYEHDVLYDIIERELSKSPDLEHVFSLIGVVLPREPVRVAFEALGANDPQLRGLAFEYLESALPSHISERLLQIIDRPMETVSSRPVDLIRQEFLDLVQRARSEDPRTGSSSGVPLPRSTLHNGALRMQASGCERATQSHGLYRG